MVRSLLALVLSLSLAVAVVEAPPPPPSGGWTVISLADGALD